MFAKFIYRYKDISQTRTIHKIIIWLFSVMGDYDLWGKNYGGKFTDFCVHEKFLELVQIDPQRSNPLRDHDNLFMYIPTKSTIMVTQLTNYLMKCNLNVQIYGGQHYGKTSTIKLLKGVKINLKVYKNT